MKRKFIYFLWLGLPLAACTGKDQSNADLERLIARRDSLKNELTLVNERIVALDPTTEIVTPLVTSSPVEFRKFIHKVDVQGEVESDQNALLNAEASGIIEKIHVKEGQKVSAGQVLMTINADILASNIDELETSIELANYMYEKQKKLMDQGLGVEMEYEQALNQKKALEKKLETMKTQKGKSVVRAPFSGIIDEVMVTEGELAAPQFPLLRIVNNKEITITASLSESLLSSVKEGSDVELVFPSLNDTVIVSTITSRGNYIDPTNRTFRIRIDLSNNTLLLPNQLAKVSVTDYQKDSATVVPSESILQDTKNNNYLYKLVDHKGDTYGLTKVYVNVLNRYKGSACVIPLDGGHLTENDGVVVEGAKGITESDRVKLQ